MALVVKYADNLYKGFGHSFSLVICSSVSSILFDDTTVNETFLMGSFLVVASSVAFSSVAQAGNVTLCRWLPLRFYVISNLLLFIIVVYLFI